MKKATLKALEGSIVKWEDILGRIGVDDGCKNCPLCQLFPHANCSGCPVKNKTKKECCIDTPYDKWNEHQNKTHFGFMSKKTIECRWCTHYAKQELDFLKSLLPREATNARK